MTIGRVGLATLWLGSAVVSFGCLPFVREVGDGSLRVEGQVFAWVDAPAGSRSVAEIDVPVATGQKELRPVADAEVVLEPWTPKRRPANAAGLRVSRTPTDADGRFRLGGPNKPGAYDATLSVKAAGFQPIEHVFRHERQTPHSARVLLVRVQ